MTGKRWEKVSRPAKDLIEKLLEVNPDERIGLDEAMRHPWLHQWP
jgi:mitogen-activated protein kinase-activated protein kinase 5